MSKVSRSQECTGRQEGGLKCVYLNARSIRNMVGEPAGWVGTGTSIFWPFRRHGESRDMDGCCKFRGLDVSVSSGNVVKEGEVWHC